MEKTTTLNLRVNPTVKEKAEEVLSKLGIPMSTAINIYLNQISLTGSIPFPVSLPKNSQVLAADSRLSAASSQNIYNSLKDSKEVMSFSSADAVKKSKENVSH